jgi:hypothetical protein
MKLLIMQFSLSSCYSLILSPNIVFSTLFSSINICLQVVPLLLTQYHEGSSLEGKVILLRTLAPFVAVCKDQHITPTSKESYTIVLVLTVLTHWSCKLKCFCQLVVCLSSCDGVGLATIWFSFHGDLHIFIRI